MIYLILFVLICAVADRVRGTIAIGIWPYAFLISTAFGNNIFVMLGFVLGESISWGKPLGAYIKGNKRQGYNREWWQNKYLGERILLSLVVRGLMWGLPPALAGYYTGAETALFLLPIITTAFVVSAIIVRRFYKSNLDSKWKAMELVRGGLIGLGIALINV